jgi:Lipocalin-like domain
MKKVAQILGLAILLLTFNSCDKYEEGGAKKKSTKNLTNVWKIESYYLNGADNTSSLLITDFNETFADDGSYTRFYSDAAGNAKSETGAWSLVEENTKISISGAGSYDLTSSAMGVSTSSYTILKLTRKKFWYSFSSGGNSHEFRMVPKA